MREGEREEARARERERERDCMGGKPFERPRLSGEVREWERAEEFDAKASDLTQRPPRRLNSCRGKEGKALLSRAEVH